MLVRKDLFNQLLELASVSVEYLNAKDEDITWITVKGNHIPIKKGQNKKEAVEAFLSKVESKETKPKSKITEKFSKAKELKDFPFNKFKDDDDLKSAIGTYLALKENNINIEKDGTVKLYHATSKENYEKIMNVGEFKGTSAPIGGMTGVKIDKASFFGADKKWVEDTWSAGGNYKIIELNVDFQNLRQPAGNDKEIYIEEGLKKEGNKWVPTKKPQDTFYNELPYIMLEHKLD